MSDAGLGQEGKTPLWRAIAIALTEEIADGRYKPGDRLPTEADLAMRFGVNRHTVRHAMKHLVTNGLVRTRRGSGAYVTSTPTDYAIGRRVRFHENLMAEGRRPSRRLLYLERRAATQDEADALRLAAGDPVCASHGLSLADERPIAVFESVFPLNRLPGIDAALSDLDSVTKALAQVGMEDYTRVSTRLTAVRADAARALHLELREGDPLLRATGVNADTWGVPVEYGRTWFAGDRVTLTVELPDS